MAEITRDDLLARRAAHRAACVEWRRANRERVREYNARWRAAAGSQVEYRRRWRARQEEGVLARDSALRRAHKQGLASPEDRVGACSICGTVTRRNFDHDHASGAFRGWLCQSCNSGLGFFRDSPDLLAAAMGYLLPPLSAQLGVRP